MALNRTWSAQVVDVAPADETNLTTQAQSLMYARKQFLTGASPAVSSGAWSVAMSSGSPSGTPTAGAGDNWSSSTAIVWAAAGSTHSWIVYKSPSGWLPSGGFLYLLEDMASANPYQMYCEVASSAYSGGSTTNRPTATTANTQVLNGGTVVQWLKSSLVASKWMGARNTLGDYHMEIAETGSGIAATSFCALSTTGYKTGDLFPAYGHALYSASGHGALVTTALGGGKSWALWSDGTFVGSLSTSTSQSGLSVPSIMAGTEAMSNFQSGGGQISPTGTYPGPEMELWSYGSTKIDRRGRLVDIYAAPKGTGVLQRTCAPSDVTPEYVLLGDVWVPLNVKPNL